MNLRREELHKNLDKIFEFAEINLVKPKSGEKEDDFISRCMSELKGEFPDQKQRFAVCQSYWKNK